MGGCCKRRWTRAVCYSICGFFTRTSQQAKHTSPHPPSPVTVENSGPVLPVYTTQKCGAAELALSQIYWEPLQQRLQPSQTNMESSILQRTGRGELRIPRNAVVADIASSY